MYRHTITMHEEYGAKLKRLAAMLQCARVEVIRRAIDDMYAKYYEQGTPWCSLDSERET